MTEDEAFIRAVVDSPGDDTPRLVYADWLDDRDDPRGPYLRAEAEWAKPWRNGALPDHPMWLSGSAVGLDKVWVARVSRPPVGVCCEHLRFTESGPRLTPENLDEVKSWPRVKLPPDYQAFLLNHNGGIPHLIGEYRKPASPLCPVVVTSFYPFIPKGSHRELGTLHGEVHRYWNDTLPSFLQRAPYQAGPDEVLWYHDFIPIADTSDRIYTPLLGVNGEYLEAVQLIDWSVEPNAYAHVAHMRLANSFADLLSRVIPATTDYGSILEEL